MNRQKRIVLFALLVGNGLGCAAALVTIATGQTYRRAAIVYGLGLIAPASYVAAGHLWREQL